MLHERAYSSYSEGLLIGEEEWSVTVTKERQEGSDKVTITLTGPIYGPDDGDCDSFAFIAMNDRLARYLLVRDASEMIADVEDNVREMVEAIDGREYFGRKGMVPWTCAKIALKLASGRWNWDMDH